MREWIVTARGSAHEWVVMHCHAPSLRRLAWSAAIRYNPAPQAVPCIDQHRRLILPQMV